VQGVAPVGAVEPDHANPGLVVDLDLDAGIGPQCQRTQHVKILISF